MLHLRFLVMVTKKSVKCNCLHRARTQSTVGVMSLVLAVNRAQMDGAKVCMDVAVLEFMCAAARLCVVWPYRLWPAHTLQSLSHSFIRCCWQQRRRYYHFKQNGSWS